MVADASYDACLRLAREHYENFPVASRLLPKATRPHIAAVYAFARTADDFADEGDRPAEERLALLDDWQRRLTAATRGDGRHDALAADDPFIALADTVRRFDLEVGLFEDLLSAFRQDVVTRRYERWDDLLDYSRRSANPVGRLVLRIAGYRDAALDRWSDAICTALQLTNFWQDLERDWQKGRVYVPAELSRAAGADEADLGRGRMTPAWRAALADAAGRTRALFEAGAPLPDAVRGRLRWELRATWLGGIRILERLEQVEFDMFAERPTLGWADAPGIAWRAMTWRRRARHAPMTT